MTIGRREEVNSMSEQTNENPTGEQTADQDAPQNLDAQERTQGQPQPRYVDPNSGAAPQPGGYAHSPVADPEEPTAKADNVTMPEEARDLSGQGEGGQEEPQDQGVEELPDELIRSQSYDTELQNQAAPLGPQPGVEERTDGGDASSEDDGTTKEPGAEDDSSDDSTTETEETEEPAGNAGLEEWQAYAKSKGATDEDLADKGRNDLRSEYGSK
jgi:hypothetical protein